ncbi:hypothetical protein GALMADRAFT_53910 [Galerina marginata CBS 339.88]|uniref:CHAT domain-containing protein n=1 Tax=Galerina marginata (strain CBS 339.88) TaxID=685588 RepID=A0A067TSH6_GALM3|nr:hypothetical protein GALMADRAFT_53910 [Galerina marginata CBS 339.88]
MKFRISQGPHRPKDLDTAISLYRQAIRIRPSQFPSIRNLAYSLEMRYDRSRQEIDLDEIVSLKRIALHLQPSPHPSHHESLNDLGVALSARFEHGGRKVDLDEAISLYTQAMEFGPSPPAYQSNSSKDFGGQQPPSSEDRAGSLHNLGTAFWIRFRECSIRTDLDTAISFLIQALEIWPLTHPRRSTSLMELAYAIEDRFKIDDQEKDLITVISLRRQALESQPSHPNRWTILTELGNALDSQFRKRRWENDINEAISLHTDALELCPPLHPDRSRSLHNLAFCLHNRGQGKDFDVAISLYRQVLAIQPLSHLDHPKTVTNLATVLQSRFNVQLEEFDLDESISLYRQALDLRPSPHPRRSDSLQNLADAVVVRYCLNKQEKDIDEAISLYREALELRPSLHPRRPYSLFALGRSLFYAGVYAGKGTEYLMQARSALFEVIHSTPKLRASDLHRTRAWIAMIHHDDGTLTVDAGDFPNLSIDMPSTAWDKRGAAPVTLPLLDVEFIIENHPQAFMLLEKDRNLIWSYVVALHSSLDPLHEIAPTLADKLHDQANQLFREIESTANIRVDAWGKLSAGQDSSLLHGLQDEWEKTLDDVNEIKGFEDFLRSPPSLSPLQYAASENPIIYLVHSFYNEAESHCLIITSTDVHHIDTVNLTPSLLKKLVELVQIAVSELPISRSYAREARNYIVELLGKERGMRLKHDNLGTSDDVLKFVLRILWVQLVKPVIEFLDIKKSADLPVLTWCPTGLFTFLPIHAAGCYDDDLALECAFDYFVSSYAPNLGVLLSPNPTPSPASFKMMAVIQSQGLSATIQELENIQRHVPSDSLIKFGVPGAKATIEAVASQLSNASIVHFACHGKKDRLKTLGGGLQLEDGLLSITRIIREKISNGSLAFLCACETAMGDEKLPNETLTLGACFLNAGFRSVIAAMEIMDKDGPIVADVFYEELFRGPDGKPMLVPDTEKSPQALHKAVQKLRFQKVAFRRWIPFIHMGKGYVHVNSEH